MKTDVLGTNNTFYFHVFQPQYFTFEARNMILEYLIDKLPIILTYYMFHKQQHITFINISIVCAFNSNFIFLLYLVLETIHFLYLYSD